MDAARAWKRQIKRSVGATPQNMMAGLQVTAYRIRDEILPQ